MRRQVFASLPVVIVLTACATGAAPEAKLSQARVVIDRVKASGGCAAPAVADAESALEYAQFEARTEAGQPFAAQRADIALDKALVARAACRQPAPR